MNDGIVANGKPLHLGIELTERLNASGLRYCHWKSNIRLDKSLAGKTDLDILVAKEDIAKFVKIIRDFGFRPMINPPEKRYEGLSDYLGMDPSSGGLLHVHLHDRLVLGSRADKEIEFPIEALFWSNLERKSGVAVPAPSLELLVLLLRAFLKANAGKSDPKRWFPADIVDEIKSLYRQGDQERFAALVGEAGLDLSSQALLDFAAQVAEDRIDLRTTRRVRSEVLRALAPYRRAAGSDWSGTLRRKFCATRWAKKHLLERRKRLRERGLCIALVGADGAGKSTHAKELRRWLGWKLICREAYLGLPKRSAVYRLLNRLERWSDKLGRFLGPVFGLPFGFVAGSIRSARWLWAARCRSKAVQRIERLVQQGAIIICDRYPLTELVEPDFSMDGPRIHQELGPRFEWAANIEERWYRNIPRPDLIIVLKTSLDELQRRKAAHAPAALNRKAAMVNRVAEGPGIVVIDNDRDYEIVSREIKREVWRRIQP